MALGNGNVFIDPSEINETYATARRGLGRDGQYMELIAQNIERQTQLMERQCMIEERTLHMMFEVVDKQNQIVGKLTADTRIAELKAQKWEEHAVRLQQELTELKENPTS